MDDYTYILAHGFGFNNDYWQNLISYLPGKWRFFEPGMSLAGDRKYIGIGHSLGFLKLNNSGLWFDYLVGLQPFLNFCGTDRRLHEFRKQQLDKVISDFKLDAEQFLKNFRCQCGYLGAVALDNPEQLAAEFSLMQLSYPHNGVKTLVLAGKDDQVVPYSLVIDNFLGIAQVTIDELSGTKHVLGYKKPEAVALKISEFING